MTSHFLKHSRGLSAVQASGAASGNPGHFRLQKVNRYEMYSSCATAAIARSKIIKSLTVTC